DRLQRHAGSLSFASVRSTAQTAIPDCPPAAKWRPVGLKATDQTVLAAPIDVLARTRPERASRTQTEPFTWWPTASSRPSGPEATRARPRSANARWRMTAGAWMANTGRLLAMFQTRARFWWMIE